MTVVVTTINNPILLEGYAENFARYGHLDRVDAIVVGDRKTPQRDVKALSRRLEERGFRCDYVDLEAQKSYMRRFAALDALIPFNSDQRRNIGYLMAAERGADVLVAVDDDNFVRSDDWYRGHAVCGQEAQDEKTATSATHWWNPCSMMDTHPPNRRLYPRGHPYDKRHLADDTVWSRSSGRVVLNAGLWLVEPDVDSLTRLTEPVKCTRLNDQRVMLTPGTWAAINTQNTAFHRETLPAFYFVPITAQIGGVMVERFGDIWAGFFMRKAIDQMDHRVTYGWPACDHVRNAHVLLKDLQLEYFSVLITEVLWQKLYDWRLTARSYGDAYLEIADHLAATEWPTLPMAQQVKEYFGRMAHAMRVWVAAVKELGL
jgi:hypothetical protein